jgi:signal transduction histidine kinase
MPAEPYSVLLLATRKNQWLTDLASALESHPDPMSATAIMQMLDTAVPDAILAAECSDESHDLFESLHQRYPHNNRPALIYCVEETPDLRFLPLADAILPRVQRDLFTYLVQRSIDDKRARDAQQQRIDDLEVEQGRLKKAIYETELLKNAIVRNVNHELRTPLLQVKSAVALIAEDMEGSNLAEYATSATARLEAVVKSISQLTASLDDMTMNPLIVRECIESAMRERKRSWEQQGQLERVQVDIGKKMPPAFGNRQGITIVLVQLIDNALKFSDGAVNISARREGDIVRIAVEDEGIGIDPDKLEELFKVFVQGDPSEIRHYGGTGVGLAIVRLILDRHETQIAVDSAPGKGSSFSFDLPTVDLDHV